MTAFYDEVELEDMMFDEELQTFFYDCPCGDRFQITVEQMKNGEEIAQCPSCSLIVRVIYDPEDFVEDDDIDTTTAEPTAVAAF